MLGIVVVGDYVTRGVRESDLTLGKEVGRVGRGQLAKRFMCGFVEE